MSFPTVDTTAWYQAVDRMVAKELEDRYGVAVMAEDIKVQFALSHEFLEAFELGGYDLDHVAHLGEVRVIKEYERCYDSTDGAGADYVGKRLKDPTFLDLLVEAEMMIRRTKDEHHRFFEGWEEDRQGNLRLWMGS